jgi:steroid delta-isomerase-like uncharacterized protein
MSGSDKEIAHQFLDVYNRAAWDELDDLVSADYIHHNNDSRLTLAQFKRGAAWFRLGMPDFHVVAEDMVAEADQVAVRWVGRGTHVASFFGEAPTSRFVTVYGVTFYRFKDDRIQEDWETMDEHHFRAQLVATVQSA